MGQDTSALGTGQFGIWDGTVRYLGQESSALRSELSLGHFGTSADLSGQFGPTRLVPKCPGSEVSVIPYFTSNVAYISKLIQLRKFSELYYRAPLNADPQQRETTTTEKKKEVVKTCETRYAIIHHETRCRCDIKL